MCDLVTSRIIIHCVFQIDGLFFAVVENEIIEAITITIISEAEFLFLRKIGIPLCNIITTTTVDHRLLETSVNSRDRAVVDSFKNKVLDFRTYPGRLLRLLGFGDVRRNSGTDGKDRSK